MSLAHIPELARCFDSCMLTKHRHWWRRSAVSNPAASAAWPQPMAAPKSPLPAPHPNLRALRPVTLWGRNGAPSPELAADALKLLLSIAVKEGISALVGELLFLALRVPSL